MKITMKRVDIVKKLTENLKLAKEEDRQAKQEHQKQEKKYLEAFRKTLREGLKWNYEKARSMRFEVDYHQIEMSRPDCPNSEAKSIQEWLGLMKSDSRETITFERSDSISKAVSWLPKAQRIANSVCQDE